MSTYILPSTAFTPYQTGRPSLASPRDYRSTLNTIIDDEEQDTPRLLAQFPRPNMLSPGLTDDLPTPRAIPQQGGCRADYQTHAPSPISEASSPSSLADPWKEQRQADFNDLYDLTDDESEEVPLRCSASLKKIVGAGSARSSRGRYPSLIIPSPSAWPTIQKLKSGMMPLSPSVPTPLKSPAAGLMSMIAARSLHIPNGSATPSLDGSFTSEELDKLSCPSTPDVHKREETESEWSALAPAQLHPQAMQTLRSLSTINQSTESLQSLGTSKAEMQQVDQSSSQVNMTGTPSDVSDDDPLSALSIPSPGGFFSSLGSSARHTWSTQRTEDAVPTTTVAEQFYGVPWRASEPIVPRIVEVPSSTASGPPTARITCPDVGEVTEVTEIQRNESVRTEYNPDYQKEIQKMASANLDRTGSWLNAQVTYLAALIETDPLPSPVATDSTALRKRSDSLEDSICSPSKKSVRFIDEALSSPVSTIEEEESTKETVFVEAFEYLWEFTQKKDAYIQRQIRADALHTMRRHMSSVHRKQLLGTYEIDIIARPAPPRPVSSFYTDDPTVLKERIARAQKERQALDQVRPATWVLEATKFLNCGKLLSPAASRQLARATTPRILDVGGKIVCDWAWQVCLDKPHAAVVTVTTDAKKWAEVQGPKNHQAKQVPNYWTFPFPSDYFDVISARSLYALLKTDKPSGRKSDEIDLCLKECLRCLKPGGYLEFDVLDAEIIHPGPLARALSVEFAFNLKTRGYDPVLTKSFLPRLKSAGFKDVKRAWTFLPMGVPASKWSDATSVGVGLDRNITTMGDVHSFVATGSTKDVEALTGLVGSWTWERWLIKLQEEMGRPEEKQLEGVAAIMEEGPTTGGGWRSLSGWARKPY